MASELIDRAAEAVSRFYERHGREVELETMLIRFAQSEVREFIEKVNTGYGQPHDFSGGLFGERREVHASAFREMFGSEL